MAHCGKVFLPAKGILLVLLLWLGTVFCVQAQILNGSVTYKAGATTQSIQMVTSTCVYTWTNDHPEIGLPASGVGDIPSFTATNNTNTAITATIHTTPHASGYAYIFSGNGHLTAINTTTNTAVPGIGSNTNVTFFGTAVSPDGQYLYVTATINNNSGNYLMVFDPKTYELSQQPIPLGNTGPRGVAVSPDGSRIYVSNQDAFGNGTISVINNPGFQVIKTINVGLTPLDIVVSADGSKVYVSNQNGASVSEINALDYSIRYTYPTSSGPRGLALSSDGLYLYVATGNDFTEFNTTTHAIVRHIVTGGVWPVSMVLSADDKLLYAVNETSSTVSVVDTQTGDVLKTINIPVTGDDHPINISLSADGTEAYVINEHGLVTVISTAQRAVLTTIQTSGGNFPTGHFTSPGPGCNGDPTTITITVKPYVPPALMVNPQAIDLSTTYGNPSASKTFTVTATALLANVLLTAPAGFEISSNNAAYNSSLTLPVDADGNLASTTIYVRIAKGQPVGSPAGSIMLTAGSVSRFVDLTGSVTPADLTITPNYAEKTYGTTLTDGPTTDFTATGLASGETISQITINYDGGAAASDPVSLYSQEIVPIAITASTNFNIGNYIPHFIGGDLRVTPAPLTIKADDKTRNFGDNNPTFTVAYTGFVNGEGPAQLSSLPNAYTDATASYRPGTYPIYVDGATATNYSITQLQGTLTILSVYDAKNIPNVITPNGDGINDIWNIPGILAYPVAEVRIFNRLGQQVYYSKGYAKPFDGTMNGSQLSTGVYYYMIKVDAATPVASGSLTIIR